MEVNADHIFRFSESLQTIFLKSMPLNLSGQIENILWKILTGDKLQQMKLPARLLLAALALSIGCLTQAVPPQTTLTNSQTSDRCASVNTGRCHSCPMTMGETTSASASACCATQSACCALYLTRGTPFITGMHLIGTVGIRDERVMMRAERPPVPPPRALLS
jgi:hypothetical protein